MLTYLDALRRNHESHERTRKDPSWVGTSLTCCVRRPKACWSTARPVPASERNLHLHYPPRGLPARTSLWAILNYLALSEGFDVLRSTHQGSLIICQVSAGVLTQPTPISPPVPPARADLALKC